MSPRTVLASDAYGSLRFLLADTATLVKSRAGTLGIYGVFRALVGFSTMLYMYDSQQHAVEQCTPIP